MKTAVLIPCYNEELTIEKVVLDFKKALPHGDIYVYDNNSTDNSYEIAKKAGAIVKREYRQGKGNVVRSMFRDIDADCYIMVDGDDTYPAEAAIEIEKLVLSKKADMVIGDRLSSTYFEENKRRFHNSGNKLVRKLINFIFKNDISESLIQMIFDGNVQNIAELERRIINIYSSFSNYDMSEWKNFLEFGGFPSSFYQNTNDITKKIVDMVDKVVTTDMANIEGINNDTQYLAFQILNFFAFQNPGEVSKGSLSNHFDAKIALVTKVLNILETQLIFHIEPFTSSVKRTTKPYEYFFATSSLKHNLILNIGNATFEDETAYMGKLLETYVASSFHDLDNKNHINYKIYYDDSNKKSSGKNVDFIVQRGLEKPIPIEVSCGKKDKSQIKRAISTYNSSHGIIISNTKSNIVKEDNIIYLPPETFAFM